MSEKLPVVAVIPNYNMAIGLERLLPQIVTQGYKDIFVLDDSSTDNSHEIANNFDGVTFVAGETNKGAGANRNRIIGALGYDALIHFLDADVHLETENAAQVIQAITPEEPVGFICGLVKNSKGAQSVWNYGPRQTLWGDIGANVQARTEQLLTSHPKLAFFLRLPFTVFLSDWPNPNKVPRARQVFWGVESNMVVQSRTFAKVGGFDEKLREHEIQELAIRMHKLGLKRYFDPAVSVRHIGIDVRAYNRRKVMHDAKKYIARKHGRHNYLLPDGHIKPSL